MSQTEASNPNTLNLDQLSSQDFVQSYLEEDKTVGAALNQATNQIAQAIDLVHSCLSSSDAYLEPYNSAKLEEYTGPKLYYLGAGTSGRLGVLDAAECPPTFSTHPEMVQGIIAGGDRAITQAVEGAEDDEEAGYNFIKQNLKACDVLVGISASGAAPYVIGALKAAQDQGTKCIAISNNKDALSFQHCDHHIFLDTGPEILAGSTRLKAGSAQKTVLNMISTGVMIKLGKVYGNLMVDLQATNAKLIRRATKLVMQIANCSEDEAKAALEESNYKVKHAVLKLVKSLNYSEADQVLKDQHGFLKL